ncbi:permease prefix domain 1-containing protein [Anaerotignum sp.]|uniref:permease prefix domain 1-containing protein n=1 Tax=Anaerotignum sp. TaxID=2039241 RepID=UPI0028AAF9AC|nr:permease prefix domain 1-containing protein [Anaerotignum sp.]
MRVPDWEDYIKRVLSHVKFKYDHNTIYFELRDHLEDRYDDFLSEGLTEEEAAKAVLTCMGDPDMIGEELDRVHNPVLGWIWRCLRMVFIVLVIANILPIFSLASTGIYSTLERYDKKEDSALVYTIDVDYREKIYDTTLIIDKVLYYEDNTLEVRYATWTNPFSDSIKWNSSIGVKIFDDNEDVYSGGSGWKSGGYYGRGQQFLKNVPPTANKIMISFRQNEEIPITLTEGRVMAHES